MDRSYRILGASSCWGAQIRACERGPEALVEGIEIKSFPRLKGVKIIHPSKKAAEEEIPLELSLPLIYTFNQKLACEVDRVLEADEFPIVLGGDHVNAVGTWNGVRSHFLKQGSDPLGLIWIDAHMDSHTLETSHSGAWHGMPLAALLGYGDPHLSQLIRKEPVLLPENVVLIGVRSFEEEEALFLRKLKVKIYFMDEVRRRGLKEILKEAIPKTAHFGVSLDLDAIDPEDAPGVGSPDPYGISAKQLLEALPLVAQDPRLCAFELVEFNPLADVDHKTLDLGHAILRTFL